MEAPLCDVMGGRTLTSTGIIKWSTPAASALTLKSSPTASGSHLDLDFAVRPMLCMVVNILT